MKKLILAMVNKESGTLEYVNFEDVQKFSHYTEGVILFTYKNGKMDSFRCRDFDHFVRRLDTELANDGSGILRI